MPTPSRSRFGNTLEHETFFLSRERKRPVLFIESVFSSRRKASNMPGVWSGAF
jgi:hypothetical protein